MSNDPLEYYSLHWLVRDFAQQKAQGLVALAASAISFVALALSVAFPVAVVVACFAATTHSSAVVVAQYSKNDRHA